MLRRITSIWSLVALVAATGCGETGGDHESISGTESTPPSVGDTATSDHTAPTSGNTDLLSTAPIDTGNAGTPTDSDIAQTDTGSQHGDTQDSETASTRTPIIAYLLEPYGGADNLDALDFSTVTHVVQAFCADQSDGSITEFPEYTALREAGLVAKAHAHGARVLMSIGGATGPNGWKTFGKTTSGAQTFAQAVVEKIRSENLDGVDLDFEFPYGGNEPTVHADVVTAVYQAVKANNPAHVVMFGVSPGYLIGEYDWPRLDAVSDYAFYFCYDWNDPALGPMTNPQSGPYQAFGGVELASHSCQAAIDYMIAQGYPANKIIVGFGFYSTWGTHYAQAPIAVSTATPDPDFMEVFVNGQWWPNAAALRMKTRAVLDPDRSVLAHRATVAGVGWWEWGYENPAAPDLSRAIADAVP